MTNMIECDYIFNRIEGNEEINYKPHEKMKNLSNLSYILAPNSFGKSTLLNLIGLIFHGHKNEQIDDDLRMKIRDLIESENQNITFDFNISNNDGSIHINAEKKDLNSKDYIVTEIRNGKKDIITPVNVGQKYKLIYDIPKNPITRLKQLTEEIREDQSQFGTRIYRLRKRISEILDEIQDSKDPDYIDRLKQTIESYDDKIETEEKMIEKIEKERQNFESYYYWRMYQKYVTEYGLLEKKMKSINYIKKKKTRSIRSSNKQYYETFNLAQNEIRDVKEFYQDLTSSFNELLSEKKGLIAVWERLNFDNVIDNYQFSENFNELLVQFENSLEEKMKKKASEAELREVEMYENLLNVLENYLNLDINIKSINKSLNDFYQDLKVTYSEKKGKSANVLKIQEAMKKISDVDRIRRRMNEKTLPQLRKYRANITPEDATSLREEQQRRDKEEIEERIKEVKDQVGYYKIRYEDKGSPNESELRELLGDDFEMVNSFTPDQLSDRIRKNKQDIQEKKSTIDGYKRNQKNFQAEILVLEGKDEHPYKKYESKLNNLLEKVRDMDHKINQDYSIYLESIKSGTKPTNMSEDQKIYNSEVFSYLGKRIGNISIHTGDTITVSKVDLFEGTLIDINGGKYYLNQMGTGQQQAAFLKSKLSTEDDRKIIAMFDEVGTMDENTLQQVKDELIKLYKQNRLLIGIIVQKREDDPLIIDMG